MKLKLLQPQVSNADLAVHYKLYAGLTSTAKVKDYSNNGNDGTLVGSDIASVFPGFSFNGSDDYINIGDPLESLFQDSFSISMWIKPDDGRPAGVPIYFGSRKGSLDRVYLAHFTTGQLEFTHEANNSSITFRSTAVFSNGQETWHHIVAVATADTLLQMYMDGVLLSDDGVRDGDASGSTFANYSGNQDITLGAYNNVGSVQAFFTGDIDDLMIFDTAKSAVEVKNIYELTRHRYGV